MPRALSGISEYIWNEKYRLKDNHGEPIDETVEDTFTRVAQALSDPEQGPHRDKWTREFYDAMVDFEVIPAGRILAGAGSPRSVTLMNCYVMGTVPDSLRGIQDMLTESALTMQQGGGIGTDFSTIRPSGALISKLGSTASGPLSFMDQWDAMCRSIMSAGHRRGAMMGTLRCDHPDIEAFIEAKRDGKRFRMFNLSILITDRFMEAVERDLMWSLTFNGVVFKEVRAVELWDKVMRSTYEYADPGVIFIDRVNAANPLRDVETISCSNPCGEQLLPPYGACNLGSINLAELVSKPFTAQSSFKWGRLEALTRTLTRMLDNVLDVTNYPLEKQRQEALSKRRIGIGITGLADCLVMLGQKYSSPFAAEFTELVCRNIRAAAEDETYVLGEEKGSFPLFNPDHYEGKHFRRNSHLMSIAPTGTISLFAGNISSGIEPIFDLSLKRRILQKNDMWKEVEISDYAWGLWQKLAEGEAIHPSFVGRKDEVWETAAKLEPEAHIDILVAAQKHIDSSVSKTINCPESITFEAFKDIYQQAYSLGAKSCTTYRPNKITGSILSSESMTTEKGGGEMGNIVELSKPLVRPTQLVGSTYRLKPTNTEYALFITINDVEINGVRRPYEIFINTKNLEFVAWTTALTVMISAIFRKGGDIAFVGEELKAVFDPRGGYWEGKAYVPSIIAGIGGVIGAHIRNITGQENKPGQRNCPSCGEIMVQKEGCWSCTGCTYSMCG